jgi:hypothetical protein
MSYRDDFEGIELHIRRARAMRSAALGALIGAGVAAAWQGLLRAARWMSAKGRAQLRVAPPRTSAQH